MSCLFAQTSPGMSALKRDLAFFLPTGLADSVKRGLRALLCSVCERIRTRRDFYLVGISLSLSNLAILIVLFIIGNNHILRVNAL